jgi:glucokinase
MSKKHAIGLRLDGTNIRVALVAEDGEIIRKIKQPSSEDILDASCRSIEAIKNSEAVGIGIGVAGLIDRKNGTVLVSPNLPAVEGVKIVKEIQSRYRMPAVIENDTNVSALGEKVCGTGKSFDNFVLLTLDAGIGGGIINQGHMLNISAELGHMSINAEGEKCPCGNIGCLENYASARAMIAKALQMLEKGTESLLKDCYQGSIYKITTEDIYKTALEGDTLSREILRNAGKHLGVGLANIINTLSPEAIILTGGLIGAWNIYIQEAIREASRRAFKHLFDSVKIIPSSLGEDAGVIGAACLVFNELTDDSR